MDMTNGEEQGERPKFGPRPKFNSKDYDFKKELAWLPFPVNIGEVELSPSQQKSFLELIYNHQSIFSLCDEESRSLWLPQAYHSDNDNKTRLLAAPYDSSTVANWSAQMSGYLAETRNYTSISQPVCMSQVVIVCKKTGEIHLCIDFWALNAVTIRDSFPLPQIEEALQAVKSAMCDLPQLIWHNDTFNWQWMRLTSTKQHSVQACLASTSLLTCHLDCQTQEQVFVASWRCVLEINSISHSCFISMTSVFSAALSTRCWTGLRWYWNVFRTLISR